MIHRLALWNPLSVLYYKWGYSWKELQDLYVAQCQEYAERRTIDYEFLVELASAALGGGKSDEHTVDLDGGEGLEDMTPEQEEALRAALGADFDKLYGQEESEEEDE